MNTNSLLRLALLSVGASLFHPPASRGAVVPYEIFAGFSATSNPNGNWAYGWRSNLAAGTFSLLTVRHSSPSDNGTPVPSWQLTSSQAPAVFANTSSNTLTSGGGAAVLPPGTVWISPGQDGRPENFGVIRFTVPTAGEYRIAVTVVPYYAGSPQGDTDFHVIRNNTQLFGQNLSPTARAGYTNLVNLSVGETIDFAIGRGADGSEYGSVLKIAGSLTLTVLPPVIATQPADLGVFVGQGASFQVAAQGTAPLAYQWRFEGQPISKATNSMYSIASVARTNAGRYSVMVTNLAGSVISSNAQLTVSNRLPVVRALTVGLAEDSSIPIVLDGTDMDGDALTFGHTAPVHGVLAGIAPNLIYYPVSNYFGSDAFTYTASDGFGVSTPATVSIQVSAINDAPVAMDDAYSTTEDEPLVISALGLLANDTDVENDTLVPGIVTGPLHGSVALGSSGAFVYTPASNYFGDDSFIYRVTDTLTSSLPATVRISVRPVNDPPVASADVYEVDEDGNLSVSALGVLSNDHDPEGTALTAELETPPSHGTLQWLGDGGFSYRPVPNYHGTDTFTYVASDGQFRSGAVTIQIIIRSVNDAPVAGFTVSPLFFLFPDQGGLTILSLNNSNAVIELDGSMSSDVDGDRLNFLWIEGATALASGRRASEAFELGAHRVTLLVSDGARTSSASVDFEVITLGEAMLDLCSFLQTALPSRQNPRPLIASCHAAEASFNRGNLVSGINQIEALQAKLRAQIAPQDPALAARLTLAAQRIIDAINLGLSERTTVKTHKRLP
jgi:hypothetical protein